jgi:hypothetical protein
MTRLIGILDLASVGINQKTKRHPAATIEVLHTPPRAGAVDCQRFFRLWKRFRLCPDVRSAARDGVGFDTSEFGPVRVVFTRVHESDQVTGSRLGVHSNDRPYWFGDIRVLT